jgi:hypothetical protein
MVARGLLDESRRVSGRAQDKVDGATIDIANRVTRVGDRQRLPAWIAE